MFLLAAANLRMPLASSSMVCLAAPAALQYTARIQSRRTTIMLEKDMAQQPVNSLVILHVCLTCPNAAQTGCCKWSLKQHEPQTLYRSCTMPSVLLTGEGHACTCSSTCAHMAQLHVGNACPLQLAHTTSTSQGTVTCRQCMSSTTSSTTTPGLGSRPALS